MERSYKRVLLKLSGEVLAGSERFGLDYDAIRDMKSIWTRSEAHAPA